MASNLFRGILSQNNPNRETASPFRGILSPKQPDPITTPTQPETSRYDHNKIADNIEKYQDQLKPEEITQLNEAIVADDFETLDRLSSDLFTRANPSNIQKVGSFIGTLARGAAAVPAALDESVRAITGIGDIEDRSNTLLEASKSRRDEIEARAKRGEISEQDAGRLKQAEFKRASLELSNLTGETDFAGSDKDSNLIDRARIAGGVGLEGGVDLGLLFTTGGAGLAAKAGTLGAKGIAKRAAFGAGEGAVAGLGISLQGDDPSLKRTAQATGLGVIAGGALVGGGIGAGRLLRKSDKAVGRAVSGALDTAERSKGLQQLGQDGVLGTANKLISKSARKTVAKASDAVAKTKVGRKVINLKDTFMQRYVTELHPLYKHLKRADLEGRVDGSYLAAREALGNSNRALSFANDYIENSTPIQIMNKGIQDRGPNIVKSRKQFDEYAKIRSELELQKTGAKQFSKGKLAELNNRMDKAENFSKEYDELVNVYKDLNQFRYDNGLISKETLDTFNGQSFDYVRQQREVAQWLQDKNLGGDLSGASASITKSGAVRKRTKTAEAELLSPYETLMRTVQIAHQEAYRNKAAKTIYGLLEEAGEAKLVRSSDAVKEKRALLKSLSASSPIKRRLNRLVKSRAKQIRQLQTEINRLNKSGLNKFLKQNKKDFPEFAVGPIERVFTLPRKSGNVVASFDRLKEVKGKTRNIRELAAAIVTEEPRGIDQIRSMLERRNKTLSPLLDSLELMSRDLQVLSAGRKDIWMQAQSKATDFKKTNKSTISFLDDGIENIVEVNPAVAGAIHGWGEQQLKLMNNFLRASMNIFKFGVTSGNIGFALPNFVADQAGSLINSKTALATHNPSNFIRATMMSLNKPLTAQDGKILREYLAGNKGQLNINQYTKRKAADRVANQVVRKTAKRGHKAFTIAKNPREFARSIGEAINETVGLTENLTRIQNYRGTYLKAEAKGLDAKALANQAARENSVDFLEMGSWGRSLNSIIPYLNAGIQGSRLIGRSFTENPISTAMKTGTVVGVPLVATTVWNLADENRAAIYSTIPDYIKEDNFVLITPTARWNDKTSKWEGVLMLKKPPGYREFTDPVRRYVEYSMNNNPDQASGLAGFLLEEGGDIQSDFVAGISPINLESADKFLSSITPQLLKPTAEAILNRNFYTKREIVTGNLQSELPEDQKYENYSKLTTWIAGQFNTSPLKVDHWIKQTFGEVGTNAQFYTDKLVLDAGEDQTGGRSINESVARRFTNLPGRADRTAFYDVYNPLSDERKRTSRRITELVQENKLNEARRRAEEYNTKLNQQFTNFTNQYGNSPTFDPQWNERIDSLMIKTSERAFKARLR